MSSLPSAAGVAWEKMTSSDSCEVATNYSKRVLGAGLIVAGSMIGAGTLGAFCSVFYTSDTMSRMEIAAYVAKEWAINIAQLEAIIAVAVGLGFSTFYTCAAGANLLCPDGC